MEETKADPWKAVHRIKEKHKAVMKAAIVVINVYKWQGEQQPQFFAEAMDELEKAVAALTTFPLGSQQPNQREDG